MFPGNDLIIKIKFTVHQDQVHRSYLVYAGVEVSSGVTDQGIGHQQQVEPLEEHHHSPAGQRLAETSE